MALESVHASARRFLPQRGMLIADEWLTSGSGGAMEKFDPATGTVLAEFPVATAREVDQAVAAARAALPAWRATSPVERRAILNRIAALLERDEHQFNVLLALETGVPIAAGKGVAKQAEYFRYYAGWTDKITGSAGPLDPSRGLEYVTEEPYGVIGALLVWNGPLMTAAMKSAPALAAGNTVVMKPPELAPFAVLHFAELCREAGLPPGVLNVVTGGPDVGDAIVRHPGVDKVSFTGSGKVAREVLRAAADTMTPVVLELGGKSANIVFEDARLDRSATVTSLFCVNAGQGCLLPTRLIVHERVYDEVVDRVLALVAALSIGDPLDACTTMGPVISAPACDRILGVIDEARSEGSGELLTGGHRINGGLASGYFVAPTIFGDVDNRSSLAQDEIFGPVLSVMKFSDEDEAVELANDTVYGLAGYLHTTDLSRAHRVAARLDTGFVAINGANPMPASSPYGGWKLSGVGVEGGREGLAEFLRPKTVYVTLN